MSQTHKDAIAHSSLGKLGTNKGRKFPKKWKNNISSSLTGRIHLPMEKNPNWKGGKTLDSYGYIMVRIGDGTRRREQRLVMEKKLSRKLSRKEVIHHKDGNKINNRVSNLKLFPSQKLHYKYEQSLNRFAKQLLFGLLCPEIKSKARQAFKKVK